MRYSRVTLFGAAVSGTSAVLEGIQVFASGLVSGAGTTVPQITNVLYYGSGITGAVSSQTFSGLRSSCIACTGLDSGLYVGYKEPPAGGMSTVVGGGSYNGYAVSVISTLGASLGAMQIQGIGLVLGGDPTVSSNLYTSSSAQYVYGVGVGTGYERLLVLDVPSVVREKLSGTALTLGYYIQLIAE